MMKFRLITTLKFCIATLLILGFVFFLFWHNQQRQRNILVGPLGGDEWLESVEISAFGSKINRDTEKVLPKEIFIEEINTESDKIIHNPIDRYRVPATQNAEIKYDNGILSIDNVVLTTRYPTNDYYLITDSQYDIKKIDSQGKSMDEWVNNFIMINAKSSVYTTSSIIYSPSVGTVMHILLRWLNSSYDLYVFQKNDSFFIVHFFQPNTQALNKYHDPINFFNSFKTY